MTAPPVANTRRDTRPRDGSALRCSTLESIERDVRALSARASSVRPVRLRYASKACSVVTMFRVLHEMKVIVNPVFPDRSNDLGEMRGHIDGMTDITRIHHGKAPGRRHYIVEWAEHRNLSQADIVRLTGIDKSSVPRWFTGYSAHLHPSNESKLAEAFGIEPAALYRSPHEDWFYRFFRGRELDELDRMKATLEAAFPKRTGT